MHLNVLKEIMNISTRYFKTQVTLSPESNPDSPVFTTPVSVASYFQFPSVPNDGQVYIVRLESSLSSLNYQYIRPESTVTATGVRAHVTFKFEPQVWRASQFVCIPDVNCYSHLLSQIHQSFREMLYFIDALFFFFNRWSFFCFVFSNFPQPRKVEPEPSQGSFLTLPLLVILIVLAVNHNKVRKTGTVYVFIVMMRRKPGIYR